MLAPIALHYYKGKECVWLKEQILGSTVRFEKYFIIYREQ